MGFVTLADRDSSHLGAKQDPLHHLSCQITPYIAAAHPAWWDGDQQATSGKTVLHYNPFAMPFVFSMQSTNYPNKPCVDSWEKRSLWIRRAGDLDGLSQDHYVLKGITWETKAWEFRCSCGASAGRSAACATPDANSLLQLLDPTSKA